MNHKAQTGVVLVALFVAGWAFGEESPCSEPRPATSLVAGSGAPATTGDHAITGGLACFLRQLGPVGGWNPYGGGLLRWWPPHCFPCGVAPDDYCRKALPPVCWPPYPPYYIWGPQEICPPQGNCNCRPASREAH
jgi:hypothetical protein